MVYPIKLHPNVVKYLDRLSDSERRKCMKAFDELSCDAFTKRPKCDIKKLKGRKGDLFRLRLGEHRFEFFVEEGNIWVLSAFKRGRGYRD